MKDELSGLKYFNRAALTDREIQYIHSYLISSGMNKKDIDKIMKEYGFFTDKSEKDIKENDLKGKGKK